ncbi:MAG: acyl-ACP--UDP-N-acetylglucosamine O-acyltransferase [Deltaproteobacteria bacterium]|nr:acyl-ACP--UDP-N-acetylglucosamine O-acyltransferase [Deltaproteobacteria bacterium]
MKVHPTAVIHEESSLGSDVEVGPYAVIEDHVVIGDHCRIMAGAHIKSYTTMGSYNTIHTGAVIGDLPQDLSFEGERSYVRIGDHNIFREHATVHRGTKPESVTTIGDHNFFMVNAHVAHNCSVGNHVIMVNNSSLAGHVEVQDSAMLSSLCLVHQFCRVGRHSLMRGAARTSKDVPPFCIVDGVHTVRALNLVGLQRAGFSEERIRSLKKSFSIVFRSGKRLSTALEEVEATVPQTPDVQHLLEFMRSSERGVAFGKK